MTPDSADRALPEFAEPVDILLVDDDEAWARGTARLLEHKVAAFRVETATSLADGRERYDAARHDCVVCDYQLGDGTGLALLETVDDGCPFILVTGRGDEHIASEATQKGISEYIVKHDEDMADLLAARVATAIQAARTERALERERRSKNALLELLTAATDEGALCRGFCRILVDRHGYECAWIGTRNSEAGVVPRAVAGADAYVDEILDDPRHQGPTADPALAAIGSGEPVTRRLADTGAGGDWGTLAREYGFESGAGIPVEHEGIQFGVLGVYAAGRPAIDDDRLDSLREFAETVGYALHTADFKQSVLSDGAVSVGIELSDEAAPLVHLERSLPGETRLVAPSVLRRDDGTTLYLTRIEGAAGTAVARSVETTEGVAFADGSDDVADDDEPVQCAIVARRETPEARLAEHGASLSRTEVEDGTASVRVRLADHASISTAADELRSAYDGVVVSSIRQDPGGQSLGTVDTLLEPMTDKQREALRHAYHQGFFERPRDTTATELADQFGVTRQTITHHLRAAERKVFEQVFDS